MVVGVKQYLLSAVAELKVVFRDQFVLQLAIGKHFHPFPA
jgi:hypothetical protein